MSRLSTRACSSGPSSRSPTRRGTDENSDIVVADEAFHSPTQRPIARGPPEQGVRVEEQMLRSGITPRHAILREVARTTRPSTGPLSVPGFLPVGTVPIGSNRAQRSPFLAITISSPARTPSIRRERWVLASWMLTVFTPCGGMALFPRGVRLQSARCSSRNAMIGSVDGPMMVRWLAAGISITSICGTTSCIR